MLRKYIVSVVGAKPYITKYYIKLVDNTLRFYYDIYLLKNPGITSMVEGFDQTFRTNPESDNVFEKLPKEKKFSHSVSQLEAYNVITHLENIINNRGELNSEYLQINLPRATLYYEIDKVQLLHNFIKTFYDNYEMIKLSYEKPDASNLESDETSKINVKENIDTAEISSSLFNEIIKQSPNNLVSFFIIKNLLRFENSNITNFKYDETNKSLYIQVNEFTNNYMLFYNDLITLINYNDNVDNKSKDEYNKLLKSKINNIIKMTIYIYENKEHLNTQELYLYLSFSLILIYIYGHWLANNSSGSNIYKFSNNVIKHVFDLKSSNYSSILFFGLGEKQKQKEKNKEGSKLDISNINELSKKYQYLIDIDRQTFLKKIIDDNTEFNNTELEKVNSNKKNILDKLILNKPKLINLSNPPFEVLGYKKINNKISSNTFITKAYEDLHFIINSNNILPNYEFDKNLPKLSDIIINKIIPKINKYNEMIKLNPNTLLIYEQFIEPFLDSSIISIDEKLYLIYDICIPYLYDVYKVDKVLDYFH